MSTQTVRDKDGKFIKNPKTFLSSLISKNVSNKESETLIDVHVNNPLHKIVELLQDIKKQKAFSFTLRGSIGIVGVGVLVVGSGIFGWNAVLCNKGKQSRIGTVRILNLEQIENTESLTYKIKNILGTSPVNSPERITVLIDANDKVTRLTSETGSMFIRFGGYKVIATGEYNSCKEELKVVKNGMEEY